MFTNPHEVSDSFREAVKGIRDAARAKAIEEAAAKAAKKQEVGGGSPS